MLKADRREKRDDREGLKRLQQALKVRRENDEEMGGHTVDGCEILHHPINNWIKNLSTAAGGLPSAVFLIVSNLDILDVPTLEPTKSKIGSLSELKKSYLLWWCLWTSPRNGSDWLECCQFEHDSKDNVQQNHFKTEKITSTNPSIPSTWTKIAKTRGNISPCHVTALTWPGRVCISHRYTHGRRWPSHGHEFPRCSIGAISWCQDSFLGCFWGCIST